MKRAVLLAAAIVVALPASSAVSTAFGTPLSSLPRGQPKGVHRFRLSVNAATAAQSTHPTSHQEASRQSAVSRERLPNPESPGIAAKVEPPSAEWDCSAGGDAGCSWEPYGWRKN